jgi:ribosome-associated protein
LAITEYFVITSASNDRLVKAIVEEVERRIKESGGPGPLRIEGLSDAQWVLMDYGDFVVHVFLEEVRRYYDLERLWSDVPQVPFDEFAVTSAAGGE